MQAEYAVAYLNDDEMLVQAERTRRKTARREDCVVNYYRTPEVTVDGRPMPRPRWIRWDSANEDAQRDLIYMGSIPLPKYGRVWDEPSDAMNGNHIAHYGPWAAILIREGGPAEFPLDQVISNRWYDKAMLPKGKDDNQPLSDSPCEACGQIHRIRFPQLSQFLKEGGSVPIYRCPECNKVTFHKAIHLARHLRTTHNYEIRDLELLSKKTGVDFDREYRDIMTSEVVYEVEDEGRAAQPDDDLVGLLEEVPVPSAAKASALPDAPAAEHKVGDKGPFGRVWNGEKFVKKDLVTA